MSSRLPLFVTALVGASVVAAQSLLSYRYPDTNSARADHGPTPSLANEQTVPGATFDASLVAPERHETTPAPLATAGPSKSTPSIVNGSLWVIALDEEEPAPNVMVEVLVRTTPDRPPTPILASRPTDDMGRVRFEGLAPDTYWIRATQDGELVGTQSVPLWDPQIETIIEIRMAYGNRLYGRIQHADGQPCIDATVDVIPHPSGADSDTESIATAWTDELGQYTTQPLPPGPYLVNIGAGSPHHDLDRRDVTITNEDLAMNLIVQASGSLAGRVLDDGGSPIAAMLIAQREGGADVMIAQSTPDRGTYEFQALLAGRWRITTTAAGMAKQRTSVDVVPFNSTEQDITMATGGRIAGELRSATDRSLNAEVRLLRVEGRQYRHYTTLATHDGRFSIDDLPLGNYGVEVIPDRMAWTARYGINLTEANHDIELDIPLDVGGTLLGTLVTRGRALPDEVTVRFKNNDLGWHVVAANVDAHGSFQVPSIPVTTLDVEVRMDGAKANADALAFRSGEATRWGFNMLP